MLGRQLPKNEPPAEWQRKVEKLKEEAQFCIRMGELDDAEHALKQCRALDPFDPAVYLLLGNLRFKRGDLGGAMQAYERAATFGPEMFAAFKNLALIYERLGFFQRAFMSWYRASALAPDASTRERILERLRLRHS